MLWANMALHMAADPQALIAQWHRALATDGFLMFSCLGPDTLRELRALYAALGWPPPAHDFTDMHDWGDMLVHAGFAEPVMDMERITLTWETPARLLEELRELGANLHPARFRRPCAAAAGAPGWSQELARSLRGADGRLALTFEIIYGHALKPAPRVRVSEQSAVSLQDMRALLRAPTSARASSRAAAGVPGSNPRYNAGLIFERHPCRIRYFVSPLSRPDHPLVLEAQLLGHAGPAGLVLCLAVRRVAGDRRLFSGSRGRC